MVNEKLYNKTVDILVQAYFNDTLEHGNCYACAVGNIIAGNCGYSFKKTKSNSPYAKSGEVYTGRGYLYWNRNNKIKDNPVRTLSNDLSEELTPIGIKLIAATGYTFNELDKIEAAFEKVVSGVHCEEERSDEYMFKGLMAVIDILDEIHENKDETVSQTSKSKFTKRNLEKV